MMAQEPNKRRFYDRDPVTADSLELIATFPSELQKTLAVGLNNIAIKDFNAEAKLHNFRSLGKDIVLPLYKSKQKLREYDQNQDFHNAINYLRILSQQERSSVSRKVIDIAAYLQQYLKACKKTRTKASRSTAEQIRDTYIEEGAESAGQLTQGICQDVIDSAQQPGTDISFDENKIRYDSHNASSE